MYTTQIALRALRRPILLGFALVGLVLALMSAALAPTAEAGKPGGATAGASLTVTRSGSVLEVTVSGKGFSAGKRITVDTFGAAPAPTRYVTASATGTFSYDYTLPAIESSTDQTWTFRAYEETRNGWKLKAQASYTVLAGLLDG